MAKMNIDITKVVEIAANKALDEFQYKGNTIREWLEKISNGEYQPVKHGRWIATNDENKKRCSKCDIIHLIAQYPHGKANYCPNCGARMDGGVK